MAAKLQCEICGGKLVGKPSGIFECENCGTEYSTAWAKEKIQEITGKVQIEGTVEVTGKVQVEGGTVQVDTSANKDALLKRAFMTLEEGNWEKANELLEQVLNIDPECAEAYLGKLMAELHVRTQTALKDQEEAFDDQNNYLKAFRFGDENLKAELSADITLINARNKEKAEETKRITMAVVHALQKGPKAKDAPTLQQRLSVSKEKIQSLTALRNGFDMLLAQRSQLLQEQAAILSQKTDQSAQLSTLSSREASLVSQRAKLGIFAGKEKKRIDEELTMIAAKKREFSTNIDALDTKEHELTERIGRNAQQRCSFNSEEEIDRAIEEESTEISKLEAQIESERTNAGKEYSYEEALSIYLRMPEVTCAVNSSLYQMASQDSIMFGKYVQKKNGSPEPIEWDVLAREKGRILVISKYALDCQKYNTMNNRVSWETCSLRRWLNGSFLNAAFNAVEQKLIIHTMITADRDSSFNTSSGNNTTDQVFLLSETEVKKFFDSAEALQCAPTEYTVTQGAGCDSRGSMLWLRSSHGTSVTADCVVDGLFFKLPIDNTFAVRPALWIDLDSDK